MKKYRKGENNEPYVKLENSMTESAAWTSLSFKAVWVYIELKKRFTYEHIFSRLVLPYSAVKLGKEGKELPLLTFCGLPLVLTCKQSREGRNRLFETQLKKQVKYFLRNPQSSYCLGEDVRLLQAGILKKETIYMEEDGIKKEETVIRHGGNGFPGQQ